MARVKEKLVGADLKITSPVRKLKQLMDQVFALSPPGQINRPSPGQNDVAKNKRTSSRTTRRDLPGKPEMQSPVIGAQQLAHTIATAKAAAANKRSQLAIQERHQQRDAIGSQARKYAYLQYRRDNDLPGISDFSNEPRTGRLKDAIDALKLRLSQNS
ncbi:MULTISPECIES: hypothetical protein [unclassified Enterobacter]|uniref:hypothetical protein n=1 Tax=unclassified Enterobacter TaxID=2608935 RepID=UPI003B432D43